MTLRCTPIVLLLPLASALGCSRVPAGRSAVDAVRVDGTRTIDRDDLEEKLATAPTPKFLGLFRGIAYDYEVYEASVVQRDLARGERYYPGHGFLDARAREGRCGRTPDEYARVANL